MGKVFDQVDNSIRRQVGSDQISSMLDNIGLPFSGLNLELQHVWAVGSADGDVL